jgi:hypothetical protein
MNRSRIDDFLHEHPGIEFPWFVEKTNEECAVIRQTIAQKYSLAAYLFDSVEFMKALQRIERTVFGEDVVGDEQAPGVVEVLAAIDAPVPERILINWRRFDAIDEMRFCDVDRYFFDLLYAGDDDVDLFDASLEWIVTLSHHDVWMFAKATSTM